MSKTLLEQVEEVVRSRVFSYNKDISKNQENPAFVDGDVVAEEAMDHLVEALADLALEETNL